jgi:hypothetical protein
MAMSARSSALGDIGYYSLDPFQVVDRQSRVKVMDPGSRL